MCANTVVANALTSSSALNPKAITNRALRCFGIVEITSNSHLINENGTSSQCHEHGDVVDCDPMFHMGSTTHSCTQKRSVLLLSLLGRLEANGHAEPMDCIACACSNARTTSITSATA